MAKVTVYLPDDLAEQARQVGINMSAVCRRALEDELRHRRLMLHSLEVDEGALADSFQALTQRLNLDLTRRVQEQVNEAIKPFQDKWAEVARTIGRQQAQRMQEARKRTGG